METETKTMNFKKLAVGMTKFKLARPLYINTKSKTKSFVKFANRFFFLKKQTLLDFHKDFEIRKMDQVPAGRCAACKYLRRKCPSDCIFSLYFPPNNPQKFTYVHKIYGAGNVAKMLQQLPENLRGEAAESLYMEASCRLEDPVYGCGGIITSLNHQIHQVETELALTKAHITLLQSSLNQHTDNQLQASSQFNGPYI